MVAGKSDLPELELQDKGSEQSTGNVSMDQPGNKPRSKRDKGKGRDGVTAKLLGRIDETNAALDKEKSAVPVTVIIPAWLRNDQDIAWLFEAVQSVIDQTVQCECIIVENGSEFLKDVSGRITIIHSDKGLSKARNAGIKASQTEYFFPLDANDWLVEHAIETVFKKRPAKGFVYGSTMLFSGDRGIGDQHLYEAKPYDFAEVMKMVYFPNGALQRRAEWEKIGGYREDLPFLEDWDYWITAGEKGICGTAIQDVIYWYRQHSGIVSTNNHTPEWERVKRVIQSYHQPIYRGQYPPMCCGKKNLPDITNNDAPVNDALMPGTDGMIAIEYVGGNQGKSSWYGAVTKTRYVAGGTLKKIFIDVRDAITDERNNPGFLELMDHGQPIFVRAKA